MGGSGVIIPDAGARQKMLDARIGDTKMPDKE